MDIKGMKTVVYGRKRDKRQRDDSKLVVNDTQNNNPDSDGDVYVTGSTELRDLFHPVDAAWQENRISKNFSLD
jgi:hypothetical protein